MTEALGGALGGVSLTALRAARVRARESARPDRLFDDPLAAEFLRAAGETAPGPADGRGGGSAYRHALAFHVVTRTRFYDDYLVAAVAAGCRQVVMLGAGLDSRAFRLPWAAQVRVFEVDLPELLAFKEAAVARSGAAARCDRTVVAADLRAGRLDALTDSGLSPRDPVAWLAEGLLVYLTAEDTGRTLDEVSRLSAAGSRLAFERGDTAVPKVTHAPDVRDVTSLWMGGLGAAAQERLVSRGWRVVEHGLADVAASYGRPASRPSRSGFVTATRVTAGAADSAPD